MPISRQLVDPSLPAAAAAESASAHAAGRLVRDAVATSGIIGIGFAQNLAVAIRKLLFGCASADRQDIATPRKRTLAYAAGRGDGKDPGLSHPGQGGRIARVIGGHWAVVPKLQGVGHRPTDRGP